MLTDHFVIYVNQVIMLDTLFLCSAGCQLYLNKTGEKLKKKKEYLRLSTPIIIR